MGPHELSVDSLIDVMQGRKSFLLLFLLSVLIAFRGEQPAAYAAERGVASVPETIVVSAVSNPGSIRIVFRIAEEYIQKASVILRENAVEVYFQSPVAFSAPLANNKNTGEPFELLRGVFLVPKREKCIIVINGLVDISATKLFPSKLVVDAYTAPVALSEEESPLQEGAVSGPGALYRKPGPLSFVIDAGHGGYDSGIRGAHFMEKDITLAVAMELAAALVRNGCAASLTRSRDSFLSIRDRIRRISRHAPDGVVSIHVSSRNEFTFYTRPVPAEASTGRSEIVENLIKSIAVTKVAARNVRGLFALDTRSESFPVPLITRVNVPAFIIEIPNPESFSYDRETKENLAEALAEAVCPDSKPGGTPRPLTGEDLSGGT